MPVPSPRNSIRVARGNYADLNANAAAFGDGEFIYAIDQDRFYTAFSGVLEPVGKGVIEAEGINTLADVDTTTIAPGVGSVLKWDGANWVPGSDLDTVISVNSQTGAVVLDADDISDATTTNKYTTAADISKLAGIEAGAQVNTVDSVAGKTGAVTLVKADVGLGSVDNTSDANKPVSTAQQTALDAKADLVGGVIPNSQLPSLAISEYLGTAADQAAMLALTGQRGDWAIRTDTSTTWVITTDGGSLLGDWTELATPADAVSSVNGYTGTVVLSAADVGAATTAQGTLADNALQSGDNVSTLTNDAAYVDAAGASAAAPVQSVAGKTGTVSLEKADVGLGNVDNTSDADKPVSTAQQTALNAKVDLAGDVMTGALGVPLGTNAAPAVYFDENTGIYSPGADQVAISTNGTGRLFVDASGNVIVDGSLSGGRSTAQYISLTGSTAGNFITGVSDPGNPKPFDIIADSNSAALRLKTTTASHIEFSTNNNERLRITSTGQLSHIGGGSSGSPAVGFNGSAPSNSLVIDSTGKVGLGTSSPSQSLSITTASNDDGIILTNSSANGGRLRLSSTGTGGRAYHIVSTANSSGAGGGKFVVFDNTASDAARLVIDSSGNVGVGTTSPQQILHTTGASDTGFVGPRVQNNNGLSGIAGVEFSSDSSYAKAAIGHLRNSLNGRGDIVFYNDTNNDAANWVTTDEKMRLDSSGRLLVGTSSTLDTNYGTTGGRLQVVGTPLPVIFAAYTDDIYGGRLDFVKSRSPITNQKNIVQDGDNLGSVIWGGADGTNIIPSAQIQAFVDGTPGTNNMPGRIVLSTTAVEASLPTERMRIKSTGSISCYQTGSDALVLRTSLAAGTTNKLITGVHSGTGVDTGGTICFHVRTNGNVENSLNSYGPISSDERLKQDIVDAGSQWDDIKAVRLTKFRYKNDPTGELQLGPIAQELEKVSPGLITRRPASEEEVADPSNGLVDGDEVLSFKASILYMKAVKALQEAMERIETLEASNTDLLARVSALESA